MYFPVTGTALGKLRKTANRLGVDPNGLLITALHMGLKLLEQQNSHPKIVSISVESKGSITREFIRQNWTTMSDKELADRLGLKESTVYQYRCELRLHELTSKINPGSSRTVPSKRGQNEIKLRSFINENWKNMSDGEMAHQINVAFKLKRSSQTIQTVRLAMGCNRLRLATGRQIDPAWLRAVLCHQGLTQMDVATRYGLSRERIRQIADELMIKPADRSAHWYATRCNIPELADKGWLEQQLGMAGSGRALAAKLNLKFHLLQKLTELLEINPVLFRRHSSLIKTVCDQCQKPFYKKASQIRGRKYKFCSQICNGQFIGQHHGWGRKVIV